jgi:hypothetical protein
MFTDKTKMQKPPLSPELRFNSACEKYLARRERHLMPRSVKGLQIPFPDAFEAFSIRAGSSHLSTKVTSATISTGADVPMPAQERQGRL